jgi:NitT/TauT family transport system substrate-binding protein
MKKDYELVQAYIGIDKPFDVGAAFSARFLDEGVTVDTSKVRP